MDEVVELSFASQVCAWARETVDALLAAAVRVVVPLHVVNS